jgi:hypothetical protein
MDTGEIAETNSSPTLPASATDGGVFVPLEDDVMPDGYEDYLEELKEKVNNYFGDEEFTITSSVLHPDGSTTITDGGKKTTTEELVCQEKCTTDPDFKVFDQELVQQVCEVKCCAKKCDDKFQCDSIRCTSWNPLQKIACENEKLNCESNKLACKAMCACGEYKTPRFNPNTIPGL